MIRALWLALAAAFLFCGFSVPIAVAQDSMSLRLGGDAPTPAKHKLAKQKTAKAKSSKSAKSGKSAKASKSAKAKTSKSVASDKSVRPVHIASFGDWEAFLAEGG
ncbi:MAG: hypothetical protein ACRECE_02255, partial [Xanthobacteraceae bacterium]